MLHSLLQQLQHATTPVAFHDEQVQEQVPYLMDLQRQQLEHAGGVGGVAASFINGSLFSTARPGAGQYSVVPVTIDEMGRFADGSTEMVHSWHKLMSAQQYVRLDQKFLQAQPDVTPSNKRATVHALTSELIHPATGESTEFIAYAFIPHNPSDLQVKAGAEKAKRLQSDTVRRAFEQEFYWRAPNQSFRHSARK